jgi:PAS domain S-box-containing protein
MDWDRKSRRQWQVYVIAMLLPAASGFLRLEFLDALGTRTPYLTFYPAIILAALFGGFPAGLVSAVISGCLASYFLIEPLGKLDIADRADWLSMAIFFLSSMMICLVIESMHRARARADEAEASARLAVDREHASLIVQRERQFLRQVIDAFPSCIFVKDEQGIFHLANQAMANLLGTTVEEIVGKNERDFAIIPEGLESRLLLEDREVIRCRKVVHSGSRIPDAAGNIHSFETAKSPFLNEDGSCDKLLIVTTDITERKLAEEALRENRELLNSIVSGTTDAIFVKDTSGRYQFCNCSMQKITGKPVDELLGLDDMALFAHQDALAIMTADREVMATGAIGTFEETVTDTDGNKRIFLATKGPLYDDRGNISGTFGISRDISEQKQAEEEIRMLNNELDKRVAERTAQLEVAIREQEAFSYSVSHDLRSPLRHINSYAAILSEECAADISPKGRDYLERICRASSKMGKLIDDLLKLARMSRSPLAEENVDLSRLATISSLMLKQTDKTRKVDFSISDQMQVLGDKTLLRLVVENLLDNAWKYTSQEKTACIEFGSDVIDGQEVFFVSDNGTGFDMAYKDKLFGAFQRLHGAEYEGNGIGLATVKRAIERHGGTIWGEGEVGSGATFYFTLGKEAVSLPRQLRQHGA